MLSVKLANCLTMRPMSDKGKIMDLERVER